MLTALQGPNLVKLMHGPCLGWVREKLVLLVVKTWHSIAALDRNSHEVVVP